MEPVSWRLGFAPPATPLTRRLLVYFRSGAYTFFLGLQNAVSFQPYLDQLKNILDNQYLLTISAKPGKKAGLQYFDLSTAVAGVELDAADAAWMPAAK